MQRPKRISVINETGKRQSLPSGREYFELIPGTGIPIFLGLGPYPSEINKIFPEIVEADYIENEALFTTSSEKISPAPSCLKKLKPEQLSSTRLSKAPLIIYSPSRKIFPSFWGPIISKALLGRHNPIKPSGKNLIWITGDSNSLLTQELIEAAKQSGLQARIITPDNLHRNLLPLLDQETPEIILSINFSGLDKYGDNYYLLREAGVKVAVWMVDNPFHILSGLKSTFWHQVPLLVTDQWFVKPLIDHGAGKVAHMPLATDTSLFLPKAAKAPENMRDIIFVGRSEFPDKKSFFAGCSMNRDEYSLAEEMIRNRKKPDFEFWVNKDIPDNFWPSSDIRRSGFKAEECGRLWRSACLESVQNKLTLFGDINWENFLPYADIRQPIDYYTTLPVVYHTGKVTLNMTSPLLPDGLTQRNFDVWAAGGFLLTDKTNGLNIFPDDLVDTITFEGPDQIPDLCDNFLTSPDLRKEISNNWRQLILEKHTYKHRIKQLLNFIG